MNHFNGESEAMIMTSPLPRLEHLPPEVFQMMAGYLEDNEDILRLRLVCRKAREKVCTRFLARY